MSTVDPISIATLGYVCGGNPDDIAIATIGYVCLAQVIIIPVATGGGRGGPPPWWWRKRMDERTLRWEREKTPLEQRKKDMAMDQAMFEDEEILAIILIASQELDDGNT